MEEKSAMEWVTSPVRVLSQDKPIERYILHNGVTRITVSPSGPQWLVQMSDPATPLWKQTLIYTLANSKDEALALGEYVVLHRSFPNECIVRIEERQPDTETARQLRSELHRRIESLDERSLKHIKWMLDRM